MDVRKNRAVGADRRKRALGGDHGSSTTVDTDPPDPVVASLVRFEEHRGVVGAECSLVRDAATRDQ